VAPTGHQLYTLRTQAQLAAANALGFRTRNMSVDDRRDVLDFLYARNHNRNIITRGAQGPAAVPSGGHAKSSSEPHAGTMLSNGPKIVVSAPASGAPSDETKQSTGHGPPVNPVALISMGGNSGLSPAADLTGCSFILPDADQHHLWLTRVQFHFLPHSVKPGASAGDALCFKVLDVGSNFSWRSDAGSSGSTPLPSASTSAAVTPSASASAIADPTQAQPPASPASKSAAADQGDLLRVPVSARAVSSSGMSTDAVASGPVRGEWSDSTNTLTWDVPKGAVHLFKDVQFEFFKM